jgi:hypothetical protein
MSIYTGPNTTVPQFFDIVEGHTNEFVKLQGELSAADGNVEKAREEWLSTTDNAEVAKLRAAIESANAKLAALAEKNVQVKSLSDEEKEALKSKLSTLRDEIRHGRALIVDIASTVPGGDVEGVKAALETLPDPTRGRRVSSGTGAKTGSNLPRASVDLAVSGGKFDAQPFKSFSAAAVALKTQVADLQKAFAAAAGVEHEKISEVKTPVVFKFQDGGPVYDIEATPKKLAA